MKRKNVVIILAMVLVLAALACIWQVLRPPRYVPYRHPAHYVAEHMARIAGTHIKAYYDEHGEYPERLDAIPQMRYERPDAPAKDRHERKWGYYSARDEKGKRFACILLWRWDEDYEVNGDCFKGSNVGKRPIHWQPAECSAPTYDFSKDGPSLPRGKGNDLYLQLIWNKYCVNEMNVKPKGFICVKEIQDLSNLPDAEPVRQAEE